MVCPRRKSSKKLPDVVLVMAIPCVMAGLDPAIHVFNAPMKKQDVDARHKAAHDAIARTVMPTYNLLLLPGDGIGPEVMAEVKKLIAWMNGRGMDTFKTHKGQYAG